MGQRKILIIVLWWRGDGMQITQEIRDITNMIVQTVPTLKVYVFGSRAKGTAREDSDIDFYVIIPDGEMRELIACQKIHMAIADIQKTPVDMLVGYKSKFDTRKNIISTIEKEVANTGVIVYGE